MDRANGVFGGLSPFELGNPAPGVPGMSTIGTMDAVGHATTSELITFADELKQSQALAEAIKASKTDMQAAIHPQQYKEDTRSSKWTITQASNGFAQNGTATCYLSSAQCVDLASTRYAADVRITLPAVAAADPNADYWILGSLWGLLAFTNGVQVGQNGNVLVDLGTSTDQMWLTKMRAAKRQFDKAPLRFNQGSWVGTGINATRTQYSYDTPVNNYTDPNAVHETLFGASDTARVVTNSFVARPTHPFFTVAKLWPPNLPLKLTFEWNPTTTRGLVMGVGRAAAQQTAVTVELRFRTLRSSEIYLEPTMRAHIMGNFELGPQTNLNQLANANTQNRAALYDPSFGINNYNPQDVGAVYQYEVFRLSSHSINGSSFQIHPVLNGSARPKEIVIAFPHPTLNYEASLTPATGVQLQTLQVLYNGQTVWDEPYTALEDVGGNMAALYAESRRYAGADQGLGSDVTDPWYNYPSWAADHAWIVIRTAQSHDDDEIQPNSSAPIEVRGTFTAPVPAGMQVRVGLFFDQTQIQQKNNTTVFALPIY